MRISNQGAPASKKRPGAKAAPDGHARLLSHAADIVSLLSELRDGRAAAPARPATAPAEKAEGDLDYAVWKALDEERYTFGPLYTPGEVDAHGEFATADGLKAAMREFARSGQRTVNKQHDRGASPIGDIVDWVIWPYEQQVDLSLPGREVRKAVLPAGTAYVGVVWEPAEWPGVKAGAITGYSLGGRAMRIQSGAVLPPSRR